MNRAKAHRALDDLLDALSEPDDAVEARPRPPVKAKPRTPINDIDKARARKALRKLGVDLT